MSDVVAISVQNHVAYVKLNRADKYNALNMEMFEAIVAAGRSVSKDPSVRAVVLYGEGKGFCSGLDICLATRDARLQKKILGQPNQIEAVMATRENRPPAYQDRN
jgi:enoyl-CoA hydratase/carnithine racemase